MDIDCIMRYTQENWAKLPEMAQTTTLIPSSATDKRKMLVGRRPVMEVPRKNTANLGKAVCRFKSHW